GFPKGCLTTHRTFVFHCINNAIEKGLGVHDRALLASPIYFNAGRAFTLGIIYYGGTMVLHERFDAEEILKTIQREKITYMGAVPTMCERMLQVPGVENYDTSSLRCLAITGGKVHPSVLEDLRHKITPNIYRTYASTDSGQMAISKPGDMDIKPNAAGRPVWCVELRIVDDNNNPLPVNEVERLCARVHWRRTVTTKTPKPPVHRSATVGSTPAILGISMKKVIYPSSAAKKTW